MVVLEAEDFLVDPLLVEEVLEPVVLDVEALVDFAFVALVAPDLLAVPDLVVVFFVVFPLAVLEAEDLVVFAPEDFVPVDFEDVFLVAEDDFDGLGLSELSLCVGVIAESHSG